MRPKILIAAGLAAAFVVGAMANGFYTATTRAFNPESTYLNSIASENLTRPAPAVNRTRLVQPQTVYVSNPAPVRAAAPVTVQRENNNRSFAKEALIVGGSAGAGAAVGAVAGGKKGAAIGAVSGGVAGLIYDLATRKK